jgi:iron(III) transport system substrate-binding protein
MPAGSAPAAPGGAPPAAPAAAPATSGQTEWDRTVAAAKQEGRVVVGGPPGEIYRQALTAFQQAYPEIRVEYTGASGRDFGPKVVAERQAGQYLWDIHVGGADTANVQLVPIGAIAETKPLIIRPDILDDSKWLNGFDWGFMDSARLRVFGSSAYLNWSVYVNREVLPESEFSKLEDLMDPRTKGKIVWNEPREAGAGAFHASAIMLTLGEEGLRKVFSQQEVVATKDLRQQVEWLTRGRYPIAIGVDQTSLDEFQRLGVGLNVRPLDSSGAVSVTTGFGGCACVLTNAPHPNAARVYLNWFLSRDGQAVWNKTTSSNSRRLDIEPADPVSMPNPGVDYKILNRQEYQQVRLDTIRIAKEALP